MIVDDVEVLRRQVKRLKLWGEASGFIIEAEAEDGLDALNKLVSNSIDVIITDIKMPNMDGIELLRNISERGLCPVTVLLSDFTEYEYARKGFLYGAFDYIGKPVDEKEMAVLFSRISRHLDEIQIEKRKRMELQVFAEDASVITSDIKQVIKQIKNGSDEATLSASKLIDMICGLYSGDHSRIFNLLKNTMHEICEETIQVYPWIDMFLDIDELKSTDYTSFDDLDGIKESEKNKLEELAWMIRKLTGSHNNEIVGQACEYVLTHVNEEISVKQLSEKLFINKSYLSEVFKQNYGMTVLHYINMVKMERAKKLLQEGSLKNYQVADILGFKDYEYFGQLFRKHNGVLPSNYKK
jgi:Response regulator containing CheY-like receiver domain and AraC-type DNA-binding domain